MPLIEAMSDSLAAWRGNREPHDWILLYVGPSDVVHRFANDIAPEVRARREADAALNLFAMA